MHGHDCSILLGQLCRNTLHEQLGPRQDINKSEDHEGPRIFQSYDSTSLGNKNAFDR